MAREFKAASSQFASATGIVTAVPLTLSAWINIQALGNNDAFISLDDNTASNYFLLYKNSSNQIGAFVTGSGATSAGTIGMSSWHHVAGVFASNSQIVYLDGMNGGSNTIATTPTGIAKAHLATIGNNSQDNMADGYLFDCAVWNVALTANEITALSSGISPLLVRPGSLQGYWPLWGDDSPEPDWSPLGSANTMTLSGSPTKPSSNPPVLPSWLFASPGIALNANIVWRQNRWLTGTGTRTGTRQLQGA